MKLIIENSSKYKTQVVQVAEVCTRAVKEGVDLPDLLPDLLGTLQHYTVADTATPTHYITCYV